MTREEAIEQLKWYFEYDNGLGADKETVEAYRMSIKALEQEQSSGDVISRQAVLEQTYNWIKDEFLRVTNPFDYLRKRINSLPSAKQERTGHWIEKDGFDGDVYYDCSECGESWSTIEGTPWNNGMKYCPNCGAKMEVADADSN